MNQPEQHTALVVTRGGLQPPARDFFEGRPTDLPGVIRIDYRAIRELRQKLSKTNRDTALNKKEAEPQEILGMLLGSSSEYGIHIRSCQLLGNLADLEDLRTRGRIVEEKMELVGDQIQFLGYFRTQLGGWPEVTESDHEMALECGNPSGAFLLVIQTLAHRPWSATLFKIGDVDLEDPIAALEFPFDESQLRRGNFSNPAAAPVIEGEVARPPVSWVRKFSISFVVIAIAAIGAGWVYTWRSVNVSDPAETRDVASRPFDLQLSRSGNQFTLSWDAGAVPIQRGKDGSLSIRDGDISNTIDLPIETLRNGHFQYSPNSSNPEFRLQVKDRDGKIYSESVELIGNLADVSTKVVSHPPDTRAAPKAAETSLLDSIKGLRFPFSSPAPERVRPTKEPGSAAASSTAASSAPPKAAPSPAAPAVEEPALPKPALIEKAVVATPAVATPPPPPPSQAVPPVPTPPRPSAATALPIPPPAAEPLVTPPKAPPVSAAVAPPKPQAVSNPEVPVKAPETTKAPEPPKAPAQTAAAAAANAAANAKVGGLARPPELIYSKDPVYPDAARKAKIEGIVVLEALVGVDGKVKKVRVVSGNSWLTNSAEDAVKQRIYKPEILNGVPTESEVRVVMDFRIP